MQKNEINSFFSKLIITLVIVLNVIFTAVVLYIFYVTQSEPVTLIGCWFAFMTGEVLSLAFIKIKKKKGDKDEDKLGTKTNE